MLERLPFLKKAQLLCDRLQIRLKVFDVVSDRLHVLFVNPSGSEMEKMSWHRNTRMRQKNGKLILHSDDSAIYTGPNASLRP